MQNTTTWDVTDNLRIRGILSYAELKNYTRGDVNGTYLQTGGIHVNNINQNPPTSDPVGVPGTPFATTGLGEEWDSADQNTYSGELQFQGTNFGDRLNWQAGLYYEESDPQSLTGSLSQTLWTCENSPGSDPRNWTDCQGAGSTGGGGGLASLNRARISYVTQAVYGQGTFDLTDALKLTMGYRYTWDRTDSDTSQIQFRTYPNIPAIGRAQGASCANAASYGLPNTTIVGSFEDSCFLNLHNRSEAPTWTIGLDYQITDDNLVYAKYSRGYRQGSINVYAPAGYQLFKPEQVDAYEIGAKNSFGGVVPGIFNVAVFYNDLTDAQLQTGFVVGPSPTTAILNAGGVTTYGAEIQTVLELFHGFRASLAYSYLETKLDSAPIVPSSLTPTSVYYSGQELFNAPQNKYTLGLNYTLPLPETVGDVSFGATYTYVDEQGISYDSPRQKTMPSYEVVNLNANWNGVFGSNVDAALFVTNALDADYNIWENGLEYRLNFEAATPAAPRMIGARLRYNFGGEAH